MNELYHHGIKGQKWGVRRYQNPDGSLTPAGHQRYLNKLDTDLINSIASITNLNATARSASNKAAVYRKRGKNEKAEKFDKIAKNARKAADKQYAYHVDTGKKFIAAINDVNNSGYYWRSTPINFIPSRETKTGKEFLKENGSFSQRYVSNAASGNKFKVRENVSSRTEARWANQKTVQTHRPQKIVYV